MSYCDHMERRWPLGLNKTKTKFMKFMNPLLPPKIITVFVFHELNHTHTKKNSAAPQRYLRLIWALKVFLVLYSDSKRDVQEEAADRGRSSGFLISCQ